MQKNSAKKEDTYLEQLENENNIALKLVIIQEKMIRTDKAYS
jgi:hypothetical protein